MNLPYRRALAAGAFAAVFAAAAPADAAVIAFDDFAASANLAAFMQSPPDTFVSPGDMFGIRETVPGGGTSLPFAMADDSVANVSGMGPFAPDDQGIFGQAKLNPFFGIVDLQNGDNPSGDGAATWTFDFGGPADLESVSIDAGAMGDFETVNDSFVFTAELDGNPVGTVFAFLPEESAVQTYRPMDDGDVFTLDDPLSIDGVLLDKSVAASGALDTFSFDLTGLSGQILELTLNASSNGGDEAFAFDNIVIEGDIRGIPAPVTLTMFAAGLVGVAAAQRCRRPNLAPSPE